MYPVTRFYENIFEIREITSYKLIPYLNSFKFQYRMKGTKFLFNIKNKSM